MSQHDELVAARTKTVADWAEDLVDTFGGAADQLVSRSMSERVVSYFQSVYIDRESSKIIRKLFSFVVFQRFGVGVAA